MVNLRRYLGMIFLSVAVGMLVLGRTVWEDPLKGVPFILYWLGCFVATWLAALVALWDWMMIRRAARREERRLLEKALQTLRNQDHSGEGPF